MSIYSKLSSLLTAANNKTGESDTTLTDAVQTLIDGYGQGGGGVPIETGTFTVATKSKTYDIIHSLGVTPNFVFLYPVNVTNASTTYLILTEVLVADAGQADWRAGTDATQRPSAHGSWVGVGYAANVHGANNLDSLPRSATIGGVATVYAGEFTSTYAKIGGFDQNNGSGWLLGKYGYVVGVIPFVTEN